jgi:hypothetical protein
MIMSKTGNYQQCVAQHSLHDAGLATQHRRDNEIVDIRNRIENYVYRAENKGEAAKSPAVLFGRNARLTTTCQLLIDDILERVD